MNKEIAKSLYGYFETLYNINRKLIELCGINILLEEEGEEKLLFDIIIDIPRVLPYSKNKKTKKLEFKDRDGLLEYKNSIIYLEAEYNDILAKHYDFLNKVKEIRNKYEHKMHGISNESFGGGTMILFNYVFIIDENRIDINSDDLINLIKDINCLYSRISKDVLTFAYENELYDFPYYRRLCKTDFQIFNDIYDSKDLRKIGRIMRNY